MDSPFLLRICHIHLVQLCVLNSKYSTSSIESRQPSIDSLYFFMFQNCFLSLGLLKTFSCLQVPEPVFLRSPWFTLFLPHIYRELLVFARQFKSMNTLPHIYIHITRSCFEHTQILYLYNIFSSHQ